MTHRTAPDWSSWGRLERLLAYYDIAELAARLSGYMTPHREGKWLFRDGFEGGEANWSHFSSGTGADSGLTVAYSRVGGVAFLIQSGDAIDDYAWLEKYFPFPATGHCGFEFTWAGGGVNMYLDLIVRRYYNDRLKRYGVRMDVQGDQLYYLTYDGTWVLWEDDVRMYNGVRSWNIAKLVIDFDSGAYERFLINGVEYPITTVQTSVAAAIPPYLAQMTMQVVTRKAQEAPVYIDEVVVTHNERGWS